MSNKRVLLLAGGFLLFSGTAPLSADTDIKEFGDYAFLRQYKSIEVSRVQDGTGSRLKTSILESTQEALRNALKKRSLPVVMPGETPDPAKTLLLDTKLIKYSGGFGSMMGMAEMVGSGDSVEGTGVTLYVHFKDKKLETELGTARVSRGGFKKVDNLAKAAEAVAEIIVKKIYDEEGKKAVPIPVSYGSYSSGGRASSGRMAIEANANIAVLSFSTKEVSDLEASIVSDLLRTEIVNLGASYFNVLDRQYVNKVLSEHHFAALGLATTEGAAAIGKMMNAHKVVTGTLSKAMDSYFINANLIDVETGKIDTAASADYKNTEEMKDAVRTVANQLVHMAGR